MGKSTLVLEMLFTSGVMVWLGSPLITLSVTVVVVMLSLELQHLILMTMEAAMFTRGDFC